MRAGMDLINYLFPEEDAIPGFVETPLSSFWEVAIPGRSRARLTPRVYARALPPLPGGGVGVTESITRGGEGAGLHPCPPPMRYSPRSAAWGLVLASGESRSSSARKPG